MADPFPSTDEDLDVSARTLYGEARGEPREGQIAVAWVLRNRAALPGWWGRTLTEVCKHPWQFSVWNENDPNRKVIEAVTATDPRMRRAIGLVALVLDGYFVDPTDGATHYYTTKAPRFDMEWPPKWAMNLKVTTIIGHHTFLRAPRLGEMA